MNVAQAERANVVGTLLTCTRMKLSAVTQANTGLEEGVVLLQTLSVWGRSDINLTELCHWYEN